MLASLARAAVLPARASWRDFSVVSAAEARYVGRTGKLVAPGNVCGPDGVIQRTAMGGLVMRAFWLSLALAILLGFGGDVGPLRWCAIAWISLIGALFSI